MKFTRDLCEKVLPTIVQLQLLFLRCVGGSLQKTKKLVSYTQLRQFAKLLHGHENERNR